MDQTSRQSIIDRLGQATNVLVTVSSNPSVDQLSACIGITLFLNKLGKHATAVFSGDVPSTIEFLQPDDTLEKNTDSLRDFIISLDKTKADKLRYKVEDKVVKIFITPYKTSISDKDFDFSQGDFNVDVVIALGVHNRDDLDKAIVAHGRILHDATVISISNSLGAPLGTLDLQDDKASSLCEMLADIAEVIKPNSFDAQMATAFLTGIVAETKRFSNEKTSPLTMGLSAKLMAAGANQQLVATNLQAVPTNIRKNPKQKADGELDIDHSLDEAEHEMLEHRVSDPTPVTIPPARPVSKYVSPIRDVKLENHNLDGANTLNSSQAREEGGSAQSYSTQAPTMGGTLTANTQPESLDSAVNPLNESPSRPSIRPTYSTAPALNPLSPDLSDKTIVDIEKSVNSPHVQSSPIPSTSSVPSAPTTLGAKPDLDAARNAVMSAATETPAPVQSLGATPMPMPSNSPTLPNPIVSNPAPAQNAVDNRGPNPMNRAVQPPLTPVDRSQAMNPVNSVPTTPTPPPVPPPMMPPANSNQ